MDSKALGGVLILVATLGGLSWVGGCFAEREVVSAVGERSIAAPPGTLPVDSAQPPGALVSRTEDEDLDPFGVLSSGIGFDTYSTNCELIDDPFADCL